MADFRSHVIPRKSGFTNRKVLAETFVRLVFARPSPRPDFGRRVWRWPCARNGRRPPRTQYLDYCFP